MAYDDDLPKDAAPQDEPESPLSEKSVRRRYKRAISESETEHARVVAELEEFYDAYGLDSIRGQDFAHLQKVWGDHPPEIGMVLSAVHDFWGQLTASRRMPSFPGFDTGIADEVVGRAMSLLLDAGRRWAHSDDVDEQALLDLLLVGLSFGEDSLETRGRPPFRPSERYIPIPDIRWDVSAVLKGLADAKYWIPRHHYGLEEALARYPDHAERIKACAAKQGYGPHPGPQEGAQSLGGRNTTVRLYGSDGTPLASSDSRWQREIEVDDFQFLVYESMVMWDGKAVRKDDFDRAMELREEETLAAGGSFQKPAVTRFHEGTWYRCEMLVESTGYEPLMLTEAEPIPGNQPLAKAMTGFPKKYAAENGRQRVMWFCFGRTLMGLQKLSSVVMRVGIEQEARRNRMGGMIEEGAFSTPVAKQNFVDAQAIPGSFPDVPVGAAEKIHFNQSSGMSHAGELNSWFEFFSVKLPAYIHGRSDVTRGSFQGDRSSKFLTSTIETANQMQQMITSSFTSWLNRGAVTMARLMVEGLDPKDIDRLLGKQPLWEGITGQINPETQQLEPIPLLGMDGAPQIDEATGQPLVMTLGRFLKENVGEIFDNDIAYALRPAAAAQRLADQELLSQHGVFKDLMSVAPQIMAPAYLKLYAEGTPMYEAASQLEAFFKKQEAQQEEQAQAASEQGMLDFLANLAQTDFQRALQLVQSAASVVTGPQSEEGAPQIQ